MMYRWFKKIARAILNLLPLFFIMFLSCFNFSNVSALKYGYLGVPFLSTNVPTVLTQDGDFDWSDDGTNLISIGGRPSITFPNTDYYNDISLKDSASVLHSTYDSYSNYYERYSINAMFRKIDNAVDGGTYFSGYFPSKYSNLSNSNKQHTLAPFSSGKPGFHNVENPNMEFMSCAPFDGTSGNNGNGAVCPGLWKVLNFLNNKMLPFWYTTKGLYVRSEAIDSKGIHYEHSFSFDDLFNKEIHDVSSVEVPLSVMQFSLSSDRENFEETDYFYNKSNLFEGRPFSYQIQFAFSEPFTYAESFLSGGSVYIDLNGIRAGSSGAYVDDARHYNCSLERVAVGGTDPKNLIITCDFNLEYDYLAIAPRLVISGSNGDPIWHTSGSWRFASVYVTTDNDDTFGGYFNGNMSGGGYTPGAAENDFHDDDSNFIASLENMFSFGFLNPFAPIFNLFTDNSSCASIPTLSSMLHSEETQVCPWFDSTTRNIVTPVLGLSSMMLLFGFAVRWLGARSGNFFEDSGSIEPPGYSATGDTAIKHGWRVKR